MDRRAALRAIAVRAGAAVGTPALLASPANALDAAPERPLLLITGRIEARNTADGAAFDLAMLERLPSQQFATKTPWYPTPRRFTGVPIAALMAHVKATGQTLQAEALNDYRAELPPEDWQRHGAMVAYHLDGQPMAVRDKGPLVIIYPFDDRSEIRTAVHYGRAVWQLRRLDVR